MPIMSNSRQCITPRQQSSVPFSPWLVNSHPPFARPLCSESEAEGSTGTSAIVEDAYQVRDLWITIGTLGPVVTRGAYAIGAVAYDGQEPIQPAGPSAVTSGMTKFKARFPA